MFLNILKLKAKIRPAVISSLRVSVFSFLILYVSSLSAVEMLGIPPNIQSYLQFLDNQFDTFELKYGEDGTITIVSSYNTTKYYPLLTNPSIEQQSMGGYQMIANSNGSFSFYYGNRVDLIYAPIQQQGLKYPSFAANLKLPDGTELPSNILLPPGFVGPSNLTYNTASVPPLNVFSFLEQKGFNNIRQETDGTIVYNGERYHALIGMGGPQGRPLPGTSPNVRVFDDGVVVFPDGTIYYQENLSSSVVNHGNGNFSINANLIPQGMPLSQDVQANTDGSYSFNARPFVDLFPGSDPVLLGATSNTDGSVTLPDETILEVDNHQFPDVEDVHGDDNHPEKVEECPPGISKTPTLLELFGYLENNQFDEPGEIDDGDELDELINCAVRDEGINSLSTHDLIDDDDHDDDQLLDVNTLSTDDLDW